MQALMRRTYEKNEYSACFSIEEMRNKLCMGKVMMFIQNCCLLSLFKCRYFTALLSDFELILRGRGSFFCTL